MSATLIGTIAGVTVRRIDRHTQHVMAMLDERERRAECRMCKGYGVRVVGGEVRECSCQGKAEEGR